MKEDEAARSCLQALQGVAEKARTSAPWLNTSPTLREVLDRQLAEGTAYSPRSPFDNGAGPNLASVRCHEPAVLNNHQGWGVSDRSSGVDVHRKFKRRWDNSKLDCKLSIAWSYTDV